MTTENALSHVLTTLASISAKAREVNGKYGSTEYCGQDAVQEQKPRLLKIDVRV